VLDPALPLYGVQRLDTLVDASVTAQRFRTWLLGIFAALAVVLAAVGVYGVVALAVGQRTQEMGIRLALGATRLGVLGLMLTQGMRPVALGLALGLGAALALGRLLDTMLYGIAPADPLTFGIVAVGLSSVAALACCVPARRVTRIDPVAALRAE
jgi:putative ABC transport system permease protein